MLFKRNAWIFFLFALLIESACVTSKLTPSERQSKQANKIISKSQKKENNLKKREERKSKKRHWKNQSKQYKLAIKRNEKRLKLEKGKKGKEANDFF
jgi:uncharacterized protein YjaZ